MKKRVKIIKEIQPPPNDFIYDNKCTNLGPHKFAFLFPPLVLLYTVKFPITLSTNPVDLFTHQPTYLNGCPKIR